MPCSEYSLALQSFSYSIYASGRPECAIRGTVWCAAAIDDRDLQSRKILRRHAPQDDSGEAVPSWAGVIVGLAARRLIDFASEQRAFVKGCDLFEAERRLSACSRSGEHRGGLGWRPSGDGAGSIHSGPAQGLDKLRVIPYAARRCDGGEGSRHNTRFGCGRHFASRYPPSRSALRGHPDRQEESVSAMAAGASRYAGSRTASLMRGLSVSNSSDGLRIAR